MEGLPVNIDIKPGSETNTINLGSKGNVPVAILSTTVFDATTVRLKGRLWFHEGSSVEDEIAAASRRFQALSSAEPAA